MVIALPDPPISKTVVARVPYLNSTPFFHGLTLGDPWEWSDVVPRALGQEAAAGRVAAGLMPLADFLRLQGQFERLGNLGIAVRGRCGSVLLFSQRPIRQLGDAVVSITEETSTSAVLLRLLLEQRYQIAPRAYHRGELPEAEAMLLIGDRALQFRAGNRRYPYETDLAFEWWLWQHLPSVFAVWAVRKDMPAVDKQHLLRFLQRQLAANLSQLDELAKDRAVALGVPAEELIRYLEHFQYRLGQSDEQAIERFRQLTDECLVRE